MIYNSLGRADVALRVSLLVNVFLIIAFMIGVNFGIIGMAWSYLIASLLLFFPIYNTVLKQLDIQWFEVFRYLKGILFATAAMAIALVVLNIFCNTTLLFSLLLKIGLGSSVYFLMIVLLEKKLVLNLKQKVLNLM